MPAVTVMDLAVGSAAQPSHHSSLRHLGPDGDMLVRQATLSNFVAT